MAAHVYQATIALCPAGVVGDRARGVVSVSAQSVKSVLLAMAWYADQDGFSWPAVKTIAQHTGFDARTVQRALRAAEDQGLIEARGDRRRRALYHLRAAIGCTLTPGESPGLDAREGGDSPGVSIQKGGESPGVTEAEGGEPPGSRVVTHRVEGGEPPPNTQETHEPNTIQGEGADAPELPALPLVTISAPPSALEVEDRSTGQHWTLDERHERIADDWLDKTTARGRRGAPGPALLKLNTAQLIVLCRIVDAGFSEAAISATIVEVAAAPSAPNIAYVLDRLSRANRYPQRGTAGQKGRAMEDGLPDSSNPSLVNRAWDAYYEREGVAVDAQSAPSPAFGKWDSLV